jgi:hypothetical protein
MEPILTAVLCFLGGFAKLRKETISFATPVPLSAWNNSTPTARIFMKFDIWIFFENLSRQFKIYYNRTRITSTLREDQYTFFIISRSFLLRMKMFQTKVVEKIKTHVCVQ